MKKILNKNYLLFYLVIIVAIFFRFWNLGVTPQTLSDDEVREAFSAYSIFKTLNDVHGNFLPLTFNMENVNFGPASIYISSIFFFFSPMSVFISRFPYALVSIFSIIMTFLIAKEVTKNDFIAGLAAAAMSLSAWHVQISRVAYDPAFSMFFYLTGIFLFITSDKNKLLRIILAMLFFALGFYSYAATKIVFLPFVIVLLIYKFKELSKKQILVVISLTLFTFLSFYYLDKTQNAAQYNASPFFFGGKYNPAEEVELERRRYVDASDFLERMYVNKATHWFGIFNNQYFYAFSPQFLFLTQEPSEIFSMWDRGQLYLFESIFLLLGLIFFLKGKKKEFVFLLLMILTSALPSGIGSGRPTYVIRSEMMIPFLYIFIGSGIYLLITSLNKKIFRRIAIFVIIMLYVYFSLGYWFEYHYKWKYTNLKYFSKSTKDVVDIAKEQKEKRVIVSGAGENFLLHYAFYNQIDPKKIQLIIKDSPIKIDNLVIQRGCLDSGKGDPRLHMEEDTVYISPMNCHKKVKPDEVISAFNNTETIWKIYVK